MSGREQPRAARRALAQLALDARDCVHHRDELVDDPLHRLGEAALRRRKLEGVALDEHLDDEERPPARGEKTGAT